MHITCFSMAPGACQLCLGSSYHHFLMGIRIPLRWMKMCTCTHTTQPTNLDVHRFPEAHPQLSPVNRAWNPQLQIQLEKLHVHLFYIFAYCISTHDFIGRKEVFFFFNMKSAHLSPLILQMRKMKVSEGKTHSPRSQSKLGAESELESRSLVFQVSGKYEREAGRALIG